LEALDSLNGSSERAGLSGPLGSRGALG
jgi:hypothetical protein